MSELAVSCSATFGEAIGAAALETVGFLAFRRLAFLLSMPLII